MKKYPKLRSSEIWGLLQKQNYKGIDNDVTHHIQTGGMELLSICSYTHNIQP